MNIVYNFAFFSLLTFLFWFQLNSRAITTFSGNPKLSSLSRIEIDFFYEFILNFDEFCVKNLLCGLFVIPFLVEFKIDPRRLKLDWRVMFIAFFGCNAAGDGSANSFCLPHRPMIILFCPFTTIVMCDGNLLLKMLHLKMLINNN